jgi:hypothetical protein
MKKIIVLLILLISIPLIAQKNFKTIIDSAGISKDYKGAPYLIIFDKTFSKVMDSGLTFTTHKTLYKILNEKGIIGLKSIIFGYDPQSAFISIKKARIIKKTGKIIDISPNSIKDYPAPAWGIFWGAREKIIPLEGLEIGDGVYIETFRKGFTYALLYQNNDDSKYIPPMKGHFYDIVSFYSKIPVKSKTYKLSVPSNKKIQYEFYNGTARHFVHIVKDRTEYFWEVKDIKPYHREPMMVSPSDVFPKLLISTSPDWKTKSLWFYKVNEDYGSFEYDKEIKDKVNEIIKGAKTDIDKISRLTHWVAEEIRYSGLSMGKGEGFTLHKGTMTFKDRCGVCKDKAGMLITMLRAAGFKAYPAMTMAGSRIDRIPADQFNHCVTVVKYKGKYKLLDPTWVPGVRELWSSAEQQQQYLPGVPEGSDLLTTPISSPKNHYLKFNIKSIISKNHTAQISIEIKGEGQTDSTLRRFFTRRQIPEWKNLLKTEFSKIFPDLKISELYFQNPYDISKPMLIRVKFNTRSNLIIGRKFSYIKPILANLPFNYTIGFSRFSDKLKKRKYPFRTRCSQLIKIKEQIKLPFGFKIVKKPKTKDISGTGADIKTSLYKKGNSLFIDTVITLKKRIYQPNDWKSFRGVITEFNKLKEGYILKKGGK